MNKKKLSTIFIFAGLVIHFITILIIYYQNNIFYSRTIISPIYDTISTTYTTISTNLVLRGIILSTIIGTIEAIIFKLIFRTKKYSFGVFSYSFFTCMLLTLLVVIILYFN